MKKLGLLVMAGILGACNGGGNGDGSPAGTRYDELNHNELAEVFVQQLNLDANFDVSIVQDSTYQHNFVVILDPLSNTFDAINIGDYNPNIDNASDYYYSASANIYSGLKKNPGYHYEVDVTYDTYYDDGSTCWGCGTRTETRYQRATYTHVGSNITFEKVSSSSKDLAKIQALKETIEIEKTAEFLSSEFGLSLNRGKELANLNAHWKKASKKAMTASEVDSFTTELLGFSLSKGVEAYRDGIEGNGSELENLIDRAAEKNGITPEHAEKLMTKVFGL